jgi:ferredoxin
MRTGAFIRGGSLAGGRAGSLRPARRRCATRRRDRDEHPSQCVHCGACAADQPVGEAPPFDHNVNDAAKVRRLYQAMLELPPWKAVVGCA